MKAIICNRCMKKVGCLRYDKILHDVKITVCKHCEKEKCDVYDCVFAYTENHECWEDA